MLTGNGQRNWIFNRLFSKIDYVKSHKLKCRREKLRYISYISANEFMISKTGNEKKLLYWWIENKTIAELEQLIWKIPTPEKSLINRRALMYNRCRSRFYAVNWLKQITYSTNIITGVYGSQKPILILSELAYFYSLFIFSLIDL